MINIGNNSYKLCCIDTNVLSEMVHNRNDEFKYFLQNFMPSKYVPCISSFTILELNKADRAFEKFTNIFDIIPFCILKTPNDLYLEELSNYKSTNKINPIMMSITPPSLNGPSMINLIDWVNSDEGKAIDAKFETVKKNRLDEIIKLKENFPSKSESYTKKETIEFVNKTINENLMKLEPIFYKKIINSKQALDIHSFPSLKVQMYSIFYRFYDGKRTPSLNDIFDIMIMSSTPYMEAVLTENFQAEVFKKVKNKDDFLYNLEVLRLKDLRK